MAIYDRSLSALVGALLAVAMSNGAVFAKDVPPLPEGIVISQPDASVPANIADFIGTWSGISDPGPTTMTFIVTEVNANGDAKAIYAWAAGEEKGYAGPVEAKIDGDMLTMPPIFGPAYLLTFQMKSDGTLKFIYGVYGANKKIVEEYPSILHKVN